MFLRLSTEMGMIFVDFSKELTTKKGEKDQSIDYNGIQISHLIVKVKNYYISYSMLKC